MKNMMQVLGRGGLLGLYPEGVRTWDGTNGPLIPTIARLIRRMRVPVYTCRLEGGYLAWPRWASRWRRIPVRMVFDRLYTRRTIPESEQRILADIAQAIEIRDYQLPLADPHRRFTGLAAGLPKVLYRCPNCHTVEGLGVVRPLASNQIECRSCNSGWQVDIRSRVTPVDEHGRERGREPHRGGVVPAHPGSAPDPHPLPAGPPGRRRDAVPGEPRPTSCSGRGVSRGCVCSPSGGRC